MSFIFSPSLARVEDIESSALDQYDIHVDVSYTGTTKTGSSLQPYTDLQDAISNSVSGNSILIKGIQVVPNSTSNIFVLPHNLIIHGAANSGVKFASFDNTNGNLFYFEDTASVKTKVFEFFNISIQNAAGYGMYIKGAAKITIKECTFSFNGWNGTALNTIVDSATSGLLGYDSSQVDLQAFFAGANTSNGGAMRMEDCTVVEITGNTVSKNLRGVRVQDSGIGGYGFISRNQVSQNIESGIYLASSSYNAVNGCENFTVYNNACKYNANNGILVIGGIDNVVSLNIVEGNWNAGIMGWHVSNTRFRDLDLTNNNRSAYNGIGNDGDADSSISIAGNTARANRTYIADILSTEVYNTGLGSSSSRVGFSIAQDVEQITDDYSKTLINIDNVGFKNQDYAISFLCDLGIVKATIGDCRYIDTTYTNIYAPTGNYYALPYSNHYTYTKDLDFSIDSTSSQVRVREGIGASVISFYGINTLQAVEFNGLIRLILKESEKVQVETTAANVSIDGVLLTGTTADKVNAINALVQSSGTATGNAPAITSPLTISLVEGQVLNYELTADFGVGYEWDFSNVSGVVNVEGNDRKIIGGSSLAVGTYNIPVKAINYNGEDSETIVLTVSTPPFSNTKSILFNNTQFLGGNAALLDSTLGRSGNGSGASDAWTINFWVKPTNSTTGRVLFYFGSNDTANGGIIEARLTSTNKLRLQYGSNNNYLRLQSPNSLTPNVWQQITYVYNGGTTGSSSGSLSNYYSRFTLFIDGVSQSTSNNHSNFGWSGAISGQNLRIGKLVSGNTLNGEKLDEFNIWDTDESANIVDIYNGGVVFDTMTLTNQPKHRWRFEDSYPNQLDTGTAANCTMVQYNMTSANNVNDVP
tara:strand:- start:870 stop:3482 length:2613 start_codon:yes stop_codon:yes gene_type:complete